MKTPLRGLALALLLAACGGSASDLDLAVEGPTARRATNAWGWRVTLARAELCLGDVLLEDAAGTVRARFEGLDVANLVTNGLRRPSLPAVEGPLERARLRLTRCPGLDGHTVHVAGVAEFDGYRVEFDAVADADTEVDGVLARVELDGSPSTARLTVDAARWFDQVEFMQLKTMATAPVPFEEDTPPARAFAAAVRDAARYAVSATPRDE
jgi:hypothetical protein